MKVDNCGWYEPSMACKVISANLPAAFALFLTRVAGPIYMGPAPRARLCGRVSLTGNFRPTSLVYSNHGPSIDHSSFIVSTYVCNSLATAPHSPDDGHAPAGPRVTLSGACLLRGPPNSGRPGPRVIRRGEPLRSSGPQRHGLTRRQTQLSHRSPCHTP